MPFNIFSDPLEGLTFDQFLSVLEAIKDEGQRLDFKANLDASGERELAEDACALANAYGGLIVIGIEDPKKTKGAITFAAQQPQTGDEAHLRIANRILGLTHPPISAEVMSLAEHSPPHRRSLLVRVRESVLAPHEFIPKHSLVVRRGSRKAPLSLPEIEALLRRRDIGRHSLEHRRDVPNVQYGPSHANSYGDHVGITVRPVEFITPYMDFGTDDEDIIRGVIQKVPKQVFQYRPLELGLVGGELSAEDESDPAAAGFAFEVRNDGRVTVRMELGWREGLRSDIDDLAFALIFACELARNVYYRWHYSPRASIHVGVANRTRASRTINALPEVYNGAFEIDLSLGSIDGGIARAIERIWRSAGSNPQRASVEELVKNVRRNSFKNDLN